MFEKPESKDQRRARLNREGREFIKSNQPHLVTEQHQNAMDYMTRKNAGKTLKRQEARAGGEGGKSVRAAGTGKVESKDLQRKISGHQFNSKKVDAAYRELSRGAATIADNYMPSKAVVSEQPRELKSGAINTDSTHHAAMGTIGDHISDALEKAHDSGELKSKDSASIDQALRQGYKSLERSNTAHDNGRVEDAKVHMEAAHVGFHSAATQLADKGVAISPKTVNALKTTANNYMRSTTAGEGAMPHAKFDPMLKRTAPKSVSAAEPTKKAGSKDISRLSKQFEEHSDLSSGGYEGNDVTATEAQRNFLREQYGI